MPPEVLDIKELNPIAVLLVPHKLFLSEPDPIAVLLPPVVTSRDLTPKAVFPDTCPLPRPIVMLLFAHEPSKILPSCSTLSRSTRFVLIIKSRVSLVPIYSLDAPVLPFIDQLLSIPLAELNGCHCASQPAVVETRTYQGNTGLLHRILISPSISTRVVGLLVPKPTCILPVLVLSIYMAPE